MVRVKAKQQQSTHDEEKWVFDSSVNHKGDVPVRASTGAWKASLFIIAIELSERLSYFGIATSLIVYLTKVIRQDLKTAAKSANYWGGVTTLMPLVGGFLADAYLGRFCTVLASSVIYIVGLVLLTMSRIIPSIRPCAADHCPEEQHRKIHEVIFFLAIYLVSVGTGGHKPSLESFGADQFDDDHDEERRQKMSFFNWWNFGLCSGLLLAVTVIVYIQDRISWAVADMVMTVVMVFSLGIFIVGRPFYRYRKPAGSPFTPILQVFTAAFVKRRLPYPTEADDLYEVPKSRDSRARHLCHTDKLKFLDKAAIQEAGSAEERQSPWRLATITKVEEAKLVINIIPIWLSCLPFGICVAQTTTLFIKQATVMNLEINHNFSIPAASVFGLAAIGMITSVSFYDRALVPVLRKLTQNERGINILQRIGIGMMFSVLAMVTAALVERKRLHQFKQNLAIGSESVMSVMWLAPQFLIIGFGDGFALVGLQEYFYDQVPDSMRSLGIALYLGVIGAANFLSSWLITVVDRVTRKAGGDGKSWFGKDLNSSRLDNFYWLLAGLAAANVGVYAVLARRYAYKNVQRRLNAVVVVDCSGDDCGETKV